MIDLRYKGLPNTIEVEGSPFLIKTDFREWIKFSELIKNPKTKMRELEYLFINEIPLVNYLPSLMEFFHNPNICPKAREQSGDRVLDYLIDSEYIISAFLQTYNIDLTTCDMHWHLFKALLLGLPDTTKIVDIMQMRSWKKSNKKEDTIRQQLKEDWALPTKITEEDEEQLQELNDLFYNS